MDIEALAREVVDCGFVIHRDLGPGLLETVYETILAKALEKRGIRVACQIPISFTYDDTIFNDAFRADLLIEGALLVELKSVESLAPIHAKQALTYLRLMHLPLGLLMNFGAANYKDGLKRILNPHADQSQIKNLKR